MDRKEQQRRRARAYYYHKKKPRFPGLSGLSTNKLGSPLIDEVSMLRRRGLIGRAKPAELNDSVRAWKENINRTRAEQQKRRARARYYMKRKVPVPQLEWLYGPEDKPTTSAMNFINKLMDAGVIGRKAPRKRKQQLPQGKTITPAPLSSPPPPPMPPPMPPPLPPRPTPRPSPPQHYVIKPKLPPRLSDYYRGELAGAMLNQKLASKNKKMAVRNQQDIDDTYPPYKAQWSPPAIYQTRRSPSPVIPAKRTPSNGNNKTSPPRIIEIKHYEKGSTEYMTALGATPEEREKFAKSMCNAYGNFNSKGVLKNSKNVVLENDDIAHTLSIGSGIVVARKDSSVVAFLVYVDAGSDGYPSSWTSRPGWKIGMQPASKKLTAAQAAKQKTKAYKEKLIQLMKTRMNVADDAHIGEILVMCKKKDKSLPPNLASDVVKTYMSKALRKGDLAYAGAVMRLPNQNGKPRKGALDGWKRLKFKHMEDMYVKDGKYEEHVMLKVVPAPA
jgi:hypothetical protein